RDRARVRRWRWDRTVLVALLPRESGRQVVRVHPRSRLDRLGGPPDGEAVLHHRLARRDRHDGDLMAGGYILREVEPARGQLDLLASGEGTHRHNHVVGGVDLYRPRGFHRDFYQRSEARYSTRSTSSWRVIACSRLSGMRDPSS